MCFQNANFTGGNMKQTLFTLRLLTCKSLRVIMFLSDSPSMYT